MAATVTNVNFDNTRLGNIVFQALDIDLVSLARQLQVYVDQGSRRYSLSYADINVMRDSSARQPDQVTLEWLLQQGNSLLDSLIYLTDTNRVTIRVRPPGEQTVPISPDDMARAVFVQFFFILTRGSPSESTGQQVGAEVPNFLRRILSVDHPPIFYARRLATFELNRINPGWVRHIRLTNLGTEAMNRLGLGVAGYRALSPFRFITRPANLPQNRERAYDVAMSMVNAPANWDFHPATRSPRLLTQYGPINQNLFNLALDIFTTQDLQELVDARILYQLPVRNPAVTNYRAWEVLYQAPQGSNIF